MTNSHPPVRLSADVFSMWMIDWSAHRMDIVKQSGEKISESLKSGVSRPSEQVAKSIFDWDRWWLWSETAQGHLVLSEVWSPVGDPAAGRPSVYLDQGHWSTVAKSFVRPHDLSAGDRAAVERLVELAHDGGIRLPLSSATLQETAQLFGDRRYEVGVAIAGLGSGWQLRDPVVVRRQEFSRWFAKRLGLRDELPPSDVVTLEPRSVFGEDVESRSKFGEGSSAQQFLDALTWPSVMLSLLIDPEAMPGTPPQRWVESNQALAARLASLAKKERTSATVWAAVLDNQKIIGEALSSLGDAGELAGRLQPNDFEDAVREPEFGGLYTDIMSLRLTDATRRWRPNDLNDVMFLACAAAYCDFVAAERSTGRQLQQALRARRRRVNVVDNLPALVEMLTDGGVRTATERAG